MNSELNLSERKIKILKAIIEGYITTGIPIGSRTISKEDTMPYSSATIRNEMADLEEMGLLEKTHTSSGRVPSDLAYRLYVDQIMKVDKLSAPEISFITQYFNRRVDEIHQVLDNAAKAVADILGHISVIGAPSWDAAKISRVQLVKIGENRALMVIVSDTGLIKDSLISIPIDIETGQLEVLSNMITDVLKDESVANAPECVKNMAKSTAKQQKAVLSGVVEALTNGTSERDIVLGGAKNILTLPEYKDISKAQTLMSLFDTKDVLYRLMNTQTGVQFTVKIGNENSVTNFSDMSVIAATYRVHGQGIGMFGIIGPTRMNYAKAFSVLDYVGEKLGKILTDFTVKS